jgi:hypothetical protein
LNARIVDENVEPAKLGYCHYRLVHGVPPWLELFAQGANGFAA